MSKKVLVTGASRGIGLAIAQLYRQHGYEVFTPTKQELDLGSVKSIEKYIANSQNFYPDILINNAAINKISKIETLTVEEWQQVITVNLTAPFLLTQYVLPYMISQQWGRIVNISSIYSLISRIGRVAYSTSKAGLNALTRATALECAPSHILVNSVCPGFVETDLTRQNNNSDQIAAICQQIPLERLAKPHEIADFIFFLGSDKNSYITGQEMIVDGGFICQ